MEILILFSLVVDVPFKRDRVEFLSNTAPIIVRIKCRPANIDFPFKNKKRGSILISGPLKQVGKWLSPLNLNFTPMLVDTHTHLFAAEFNEDRKEVVQRALDLNVKRLLLPNIDLASVSPMIALSRIFPENCYPMIGLHPCSVTESGIENCREILKRFDEAVFYAIGEIGLDYYWDTTYKVQQEEVFRLQLRFAIEKNLPVAIHTRNSFDHALEIVKEEHQGKLRGVFHCFGGTYDDAKSVIVLGGFYLGIGGIITFKNSNLTEVIKNIPLEFLLLETDAPYLAPVPYRGKRNESSYLPLIAEKIADAKNIPVEEVIHTTTSNAINLFNLPDGRPT